MSKAIPQPSAAETLTELNGVVDRARLAVTAATRHVAECETALAHAENFDADVKARAALRQAKTAREEAINALSDIEAACRTQSGELRTQASNEIISRHRESTTKQYRALCGEVLEPIRTLLKAADAVTRFCDHTNAECMGDLGQIGIQASCRLHEDIGVALHPARAHLQNVERTISAMLE